jgi:hypothetical protein
MHSLWLQLRMCKLFGASKQTPHRSSLESDAALLLLLLAAAKTPDAFPDKTPGFKHHVLGAPSSTLSPGCIISSRCSCIMVDQSNG